jgi:heat shock protein HslJ
MKIYVLPLLLMLAFLNGCAELKGKLGDDSDPQVVNAQTAQKLNKREWNLKTLEVDGRQVVLDVDARITIKFEPNGQVVGFGAVNRFSGTYSLSEDGVLNWGKPAQATTRRKDPPELMEKERAFLMALGKTTAAILAKHTLQLQSDDSTTVLMFIEAGY